MLNDSTISIAPARLSHSETASANLDVHFVSPSPVLSPGIAGLQPGSRSHAGAWRSQEKLWGTGGVLMKQTSSPLPLRLRRRRGASLTAPLPSGRGLG